jgi:thiol:disulfide interchange protein DsbA
MRTYITGLLLSLTVAAGAQAATNWIEGRHYFVIKPAVPTTVGPGKVEVTEVFSYGCPACYQFYPTIDKLKASLPKNAEMKYLHASWNNAEQWPLFQRSFLAAEALGVADKANTAMFKAIWESDELAVIDRRTNAIKKPPPTLEKVAAFYERVTGVKKDDFLKMAKSFSIEVRIKGTEDAIKAVRAEETPTLIVNGKYRVTRGSAGGDEAAVELVKWLVAKETK